MDTPQPNKPVNQFHHIVRLDVEVDGINGWQVIVTRNNITTKKLFTDAYCGGRDESLQAAISYREEFLAKTDHFAHQIWIRSIIRRNNKSGIPGVIRGEHRDKRFPNTRYVFWAAKWTDELGVSRQRSFSVLRFGELEAKQLAIAERERQLERVCIAKGSHWSDPLITKKRKSKPQTPDM